jgi:hypothetical protein
MAREKNFTNLKVGDGLLVAVLFAFFVSSVLSFKL